MAASAQSGTQFDIELSLHAAIVRGDVVIPPYPGVALRLAELVRREDWGTKEVVALVSADPVLAADVIRCANSAYYGRAQVTALQPAIGRVGAQEVVRLALISGLGPAARAPGHLAKIKRHAWQDGVAAALISQMLAKLRGLGGDQAFLCGLLHDFGWVVGLNALEELIHKQTHVPARTAEAWGAVIDKVHVGLGITVATKWGLPQLLRDVIAHHHEAKVPAGPFAPMVELVQAADQVVALLGSQPSVQAADLAQLSKLRPGEAARLAELLPSIPSALAAFETEATGRPTVTKVLLPPSALPAEGAWHPVEQPVVLHGRKKPGEWKLDAVGPRAFAIVSKDPLPEGVLLDAEIGAQTPPLRLWARSGRCSIEEGGFRIECKPLLLHGEVLEQWNGLISQAQKRPAAAS
jgi:HD-like signal output (HDOD) protein